MSKQMQTSRAEMPDPMPESSGRNPQGYGVGASNDTAMRGNFSQRTDRLMEAVVGRENMFSAYNRVVRNKGAAGVDAMSIKELKSFLQAHWAQIKEQLLKGSYKPQPVLRIEIPKPGGKGMRKLGIPTVLDRLIQQAVQQVLTPLLSNILLDDLDKELERRGHSFCRYADDCNIYVGSRRAGERLLNSLEKYVTGKLRLKINRSKSAVDRPWNRKFLGYTVTFHKPPRLKVASVSVARLKGKLKDAFRRGKGRNLKKFITELQPVLRGWINYFRLSEVKGVFEELDGWIRRRLRCVLWRQWKRRYTRVKRMMKYGISEARAWKSASNSRGPWWNSGASHMNQAFPKKFFDRLGLVSLLDTMLMFTNNSRTAVYGTVRTVV